MGSDGYQTQRRSSWVLVKDRAERVLADAITIDGRKEWTCKLCSETNVWTRWRCRRCFSNISAGLQGKHKKDAFGKSKGWYSGSSSSSGEARKPCDQEKKLKGCVQRRSCSVSRKDGARAPRRKESKREEEVVWKRIARWRLKETDCKKKLDERKKHLQRQLRDIGKLTDMDQVLRDRQKGSWKEEL